MQKIIDYPARITRFVPTLPDNQACVFDEVTRINIVARDVFDAVERIKQKELLRATRSIDVYVDRVL